MPEKPEKRQDLDKKIPEKPPMLPERPDQEGPTQVRILRKGWREDPQERLLDDIYEQASSLDKLIAIIQGYIDSKETHYAIKDNYVLGETAPYINWSLVLEAIKEYEGFAKQYIASDKKRDTYGNIAWTTEKWNLLLRDSRIPTLRHQTNKERKLPSLRNLVMRLLLAKYPDLPKPSAYGKFGAPIEDKQ